MIPPTPLPTSTPSSRRWGVQRVGLVVLLSLLALPALAALVLAVAGWNWARGPLQTLVLERTGRVLRLDGDLAVAWAWPPQVRAERVSFANPSWAVAPQLLQADAIEGTLDAGELMHGRLALPTLRLTRPRVFLEQSADAAGTPRRSWLLDLRQTDDSARVPIGLLALDRGELQYTDTAEGTALRAALHTDEASALSLVFQIDGRLRSQPLTATGRAAPLMDWREAGRASALQIEVRSGATHLQARGSLTGLGVGLATDLEIELEGNNLAALAPLLRLPLPPTPPYRTAGRLVRDGALWRYASFTAQVGQSDIAGTLVLDTAPKRPLLRGGLSSRRLDLADLGPAAGVTAPARTADPRSPKRLWPELPLDTLLWGRLDADVYFAAQSLQQRGSQPLDRLQGRLQLDDRRLTLDPLAFGIADGRLQATLVLDARQSPLSGRLVAQLRHVPLQRLLPAAAAGLPVSGRLDGDATLSGHGPSLGRQLAGADGRLSLVVQHGSLSRLLMEKIGLHLLEILRLQLGGDEPVALHCAVADFDLRQGRLQARALVLDTSVSTVVGSGTVDLAAETVDLRFVPRTKVDSVIALRSPLHLRGPLSQPVASVDGAALAARGVGALVLGLVNPLLALASLFEAGPGPASPCAQLVQQARSPVPPPTLPRGRSRSR